MKKTILVAAVVGCLSAVIASVRIAGADRNASGTFSLAAGNPVTSGTTVSSTWANNTLSDIATNITDSLSRSGEGAMLAPLKATNGSNAAPSLTFDSDPDTGIYRIGANNLGAAVGGTKILDVASTGLSIVGGATVAQGTTDTDAVTCTGNGTGDGIQSTGGGTSGAGGRFLGGASNGIGVHATGDGTGAGVNTTGGDSSGAGVTALGGASNGDGVNATGDGTGAGVVAVGGDNAGNGVTATGGATNGKGIVAAGHGTGVGGSFANGTAATTTAAQNALELTNGYLKFSGVTEPDSDQSPGTNTLVPKGLIKAWAYIRISNANPFVPSVLAGMNVTAVSRVDDNTLRVTVGNDFANANLAVFAMSGETGPTSTIWQATTLATTHFDIQPRLSSTTALIDMDSNGGPWQVAVVALGVQ